MYKNKFICHRCKRPGHFRSECVALQELKRQKSAAYKRKMCSFVLKGRDCPKGTRCSYAHSEMELQEHHHDDTDGEDPEDTLKNNNAEEDLENTHTKDTNNSTEDTNNSTEDTNNSTEDNAKTAISMLTTRLHDLSKDQIEKYIQLLMNIKLKVAAPQQPPPPQPHFQPHPFFQPHLHLHPHFQPHPPPRRHFCRTVRSPRSPPCACC
jgi:hypothetical protein